MVFLFLLFFFFPSCSRVVFLRPGWWNQSVRSCACTCRIFFLSLRPRSLFSLPLSLFQFFFEAGFEARKDERPTIHRSLDPPTKTRDDFYGHQAAAAVKIGRDAIRADRKMLAGIVAFDLVFRVHLVRTKRNFIILPSPRLY